MLSLKFVLMFLSLWSSLELFFQIKYRFEYWRWCGLLWAASVAGLVAVFLP